MVLWEVVIHGWIPPISPRQGVGWQRGISAVVAVVFSENMSEHFSWLFQQEDISMATGSVKWFNNAKGFGFITQGGEEDIFVHYSQIQEEGFKTLKQGEVVEFELRRGPKGLHAANVVRMNAHHDQPSA